MKKLNVMVSIFCISIVLTTPITTFASQPASESIKAVTPYANYWYGVITASNVNIRANSGTSLGQVSKGDTFKIDLSLDGRYFSDFPGVYFRYITMTSGQNSGLSGWVSIDYFAITG
jgi:hypothetical protein